MNKSNFVKFLEVFITSWINSLIFNYGGHETLLWPFNKGNMRNTKPIGLNFLQFHYVSKIILTLFFQIYVSHISIFSLIIKIQSFNLKLAKMSNKVLTKLKFEFLEINLE